MTLSLFCNCRRPAPTKVLFGFLLYLGASNGQDGCKRLLGNVPVFRGPWLLPPSQVGGRCRGDLPTLKTKSSTTLPSSGSVRLPSLDQIISQAAEEAACAIGPGGRDLGSNYRNPISGGKEDKSKASRRKATWHNIG
ncbi:hypothetical protein CIRG_07123 [Coccidioides immitis RMSCC 2394]|uniref:Uncharacterized protein n=1 Tax=Coccidioides immitis RMSCC 2394 TaxID=404692 RepID=A0A0J7BBK8_COCIT|nr:hypothetical protein CIRG_07123 [Coccidioides immitis RMSCC 2394]